MALPTSGQLAISQISDEFGGGSRSNVNLRTLSSTAGLSVPDGFNEFYGLSAFTPPSYLSGANSISGAGIATNPYIVTVDLTSSSWNFVSAEEYAICDWNGFGEVVNWYGKTGPNVSFRIDNLNPMKMKMQITTFTSNMCIAGYSYAALYQNSLFLDGPTYSSYIYKFSYGSLGGETQTARDKIINQVYESGALKANVTVGQTLNIYQQSQHSFQLEYDGDCDGYFEEVVNTGCPVYQINAYTYKLWFEPI